MFFRILVVLFFVILSSCKKDNPRLHYSCDIDALVPWTEHISFRKKPGHTGNYVSLADSSFPYTIGFKKKVSEITNGQIFRAKIEAWVNYTSNAEGHFVCVVDSAPGKRYIFLDEEIDYDKSNTGKWQKVHSMFYLPKTLKQEDIIYLFIWNLKSGEILADDMDINFTEY